MDAEDYRRLAGSCGLEWHGNIEALAEHIEACGYEEYEERERERKREYLRRKREQASDD